MDNNIYYMVSLISFVAPFIFFGVYSIWLINLIKNHNKFFIKIKKYNNKTFRVYYEKSWDDKYFISIDLLTGYYFFIKRWDNLHITYYVKNPNLLSNKDKQNKIDVSWDEFLRNYVW